MPDTAIRIFSPTKGFLKEKIKSIDVKSREDARKIGPFCNDDKELMFWVNWHRRENNKIVKPYFRRYADKKVSIRNFSGYIKTEIDEVEKEKKKDIHKKTQEVLKNSLTKLLNDKISIDWAFNDPRLTDFTLKGDLLSDVVLVDDERIIKPPFVNYYRLDIALLGEKIYKKNIILGAIEIEHTHEVDLVKTLLCKSLGFPLFTFNISDVNYDEITEEWCIKRLTETKFNSGDERRRNYVYIHNMLYPVFLSGYEDWEIGDKHQYIIFATDEEITRVQSNVKTLKRVLALSDRDVNLQIVNKNPHDKGSMTQFENEGALTGENWKNYNKDRFIRLIITRPRNKSGSIYKFHLILTQLLTLHIDCIVGYKYDIGKTNYDWEKPIWKARKYVPNPNPPPKKSEILRKFCPKRISEPVREIIKYINREI